MQTIFNNREVAIGCWVILVVIVLLFTKAGIEFIKTTLPILFCKKFVFFYIVFMSFLALTVYLMYVIGYWNYSLLKDTIFWVLIVEIPLFAKTIEKEKGNRFFTKLIRENLAFITIITFILNFWTFSLVIELLIVPIALFLAALYALAAKDEKNKPAKHLLQFIYGAFIILVIISAIKNTIQNPYLLINAENLRIFILPILLLFLNLPVVYGLALYNNYEQMFIRLKGNHEEKKKMKYRLFCFANVNLEKISVIRSRHIQIFITSLTDKDMEQNLLKVSKYLDGRVGDNFMKRANFYKLWSTLGLVVSLVILFVCNSNVGLNDLLTFNFLIDYVKLKEILTYIASIGIVICAVLFIFSIGFKKKKYEEITQVKKLALHDFFYILQKQHSKLKEFPPIDNPVELLHSYLIPAYELHKKAIKVIHSFDNLLTQWELDAIKQLELYSGILVKCISIEDDALVEMSPGEFEMYYNQKIKDAPQNEKINTFIYDVKTNIEKYSEQVNYCFDEFVNCL